MNRREPTPQQGLGLTQDQLEALTAQLGAGGGQSRRPKRKRSAPEPYLGPPDFQAREHSETYRERENRLGVTNEPPELRERDAEIVPARSRTGITMSPQPPVIEIKAGGRKDGQVIGHERDTAEYTPRSSTVAFESFKEGLAAITGFALIRRAFERRRLDRDYIRKGEAHMAVMGKDQATLDAEYEQRRQAAKKMPRKL